MRIAFAALLLIALPLFVNASTCGDGVCTVGMGEGTSQYEDVSTCYEDCRNKQWQECEVPLSGGVCEVFDREIRFSEITRNGCGSMDPNLEFSTTYNGVSKDMRIGDAGAYPLFDNMEISFMGWPCSVTTTTQRFYITQTSYDYYDRILEIEQTEYTVAELEEKQRIDIGIVDYGLLEQTVRINHYRKAESHTASSQRVNSLSTYISYNNGVEPHIRVIEAKLTDSNEQHVLAEETQEIIIHECLSDIDCAPPEEWKQGTCNTQPEINVCETEIIHKCDVDTECPSSSLFKQGVCVEDQYRACQEETNTKNIIYTVIAAVILLALLVVSRKR